MIGKRKNLRFFVKILGLFFIILGIISSSILLYLNFIYKENVSFTISSPSGEDIILKENSPEGVDKGTILEIKTNNLNIRAPIVEGVGIENLKKGVGHHPDTPWPELSGNVVLAGHRWYPGTNPYYRIFYDLDKLKVGEKIFIYYEGGKFTYEIIEQKIVLPSDIEILKQTKEPILTLYTCTPRFTAKKRLVFVAKLISWKPQF